MKLTLAHDVTLPTGVLGLAVQVDGRRAFAACADGSINAVAWEYLAVNEPSLMTLGADATFDEVAAAAAGVVLPQVRWQGGPRGSIGAAHVPAAWCIRR